MKKRVLIVEDDRFIADMMVQALSKADFEVDLALDAEEGLKKLKEKTPDIILLDLILPGMNGFEFLERVKKEKETSQIPVVIVSNLGSQEEIQKGLRLGAAAYLIKAHILSADLIKKVKEILQ